jgi:hypothetical protein
MPADYLAVKQSCMEKKEKSQGHPCSEKQIQTCKKMAAIWWVKKHGKPFPKEETKAASFSFRFEYNDLSADGDIAQNIQLIEKDIISGITFAQDAQDLLVHVDIQNESESFSFTQPFVKTDVNYKEDELNTDGWHTIPCSQCVHFVYGPQPVTTWERGFCHLVQGIINSEYTCDMFARSLISNEENDGDEIGE